MSGGDVTELLPLSTGVDAAEDEVVEISVVALLEVGEELVRLRLFSGDDGTD